MAFISKNLFWMQPFFNFRINKRVNFYSKVLKGENKILQHFTSCTECQKLANIFIVGKSWNYSLILMDINSTKFYKFSIIGAPVRVRETTRTWNCGRSSKTQKMWQNRPKCGPLPAVLASLSSQLFCANNQQKQAILLGLPDLYYY